MQAKETGLRNNRSLLPFEQMIREVWDKAVSLNPLGKSLNIDGIDHCYRVDRNLERLIKNKCGGSYTPKEKFLLSAAAALHDIYKGSAMTGYLDHGKMAADKIEDIDFDTVNSTILSAIGHIARIHDNGNIMEVPMERWPWDGEKISLPRLSLLFKIADMLDSSVARVNRLRAKAGLDEVNDKDSARLGIHDWEIEKPGVVLLHLDPKNEVQLEHCLKAVHLLNNELKQYALALHLLDYPVTFRPTLVATSKSPQIREKFNILISDSSFLASIEELGKYPIFHNSAVLLAFTRRVRGKLQLLMRFNENWNKWLLPSTPMPNWVDSTPKLLSALVSKLHQLEEKTFTMGPVSGDIFDTKISGRTSQRTEYQFKIALVKITDKSVFASREFEIGNRKYKWFTVSEITKDKSLSSGNEKVLGSVMELFR